MGPMGPKGQPGTPGITGPRGFTGERGNDGKPGAQGPKGDKGVQGVEGEPGKRGSQGVAGPQGPKGDVGPRGFDGVRGAIGPTGATGPQGDIGPQGVIGPQGPVGRAGPQGERGPRGDGGAPGVPGAAGSPGAPGAPGAPAIPPMPAGTGVINGMVRSAVTAQPISGAQVSLTWGGVVRSTTISDGRGSFRFNALPADNFVITSSAPGQATIGQTISLAAGATRDYSVALGPLLGARQARIVLTWNALPTDLDSHLGTPNGCRVSYSNRNCPGVSLSADVTNGWGPETMLLNSPPPGRYNFKVHQYSSAGSLRDSGATLSLIHI